MKTSRLSLATALALGLTTSSLSAANTDMIDIPLVQNVWKFIGVKSGFSETAASGSPFDKSVFEASKIEIIDDNLSTEVNGTSAQNTLLVSFRVIDHNDQMEYSSANMYVRPRTPDNTNMMNEMYVYSNENNTTPTIRIAYQTQYETDNFYLELNGSANVYEGTFESQAEYDNPQKLTQLSGAGMGRDENLSIEYVWDLNLSNNPGRSGVSGSKNDYTKTSHHNTINDRTINVDENISVYHYNASTTSWETCITGSSTTNYKLDTSSCDFTEFEAGKGYWVKTGHKTVASGLVLGDGTVADSSYNVTNGWNMLALNDADLAPRGGSALVVELNSSSFGSGLDEPVAFIIEDSEGTVSFELNSTPYYFAHVSVTENNLSKMIQMFNRQIGSHIKDSNISDTFNIKFYEANVSGNDSNATLIVSDSKFRIKEKSASLDHIGSVKTIGDRNPISISTGGRSQTLDLDNFGVSSVFGETALAIRRIDMGTAHTASYDEIDTSGRDINFSSVTTDFDVANTAITNTISIDTDFDGGLDTAVIADENGTNFWIRERVFTRKYQIVGSPNRASGATLDIDLEQNKTSEVYATVATPTSSQIVDKIENATNKPADFDLKAYDDQNSTIYVLSEKADFRNFAITQSDGNETILKLVSSEGDDNASGIVREVYTLADLGRATVDTGVKYDINITKHSVHSSASVESYLELDMKNFVHYPNRKLSASDTNKTIRFGIWDERNTTAKIMANADYYQSVQGIIVGTDYVKSDSDVNFSVSAADLNTSTNEAIAKIWSEAFNKFFTDTNQSFNVKASYNTTGTQASLILKGDINVTITRPTVGVAGAEFLFGNLLDNDSREKNSTTLVSESNLSIPTDIPDLGYEKVYAANMNTDINNPISVLQRKTDADGNYYKVTKVLTTNEHKDKISWSFIDMTKYSSGWFDDNDPYNIFSFDGEKGYWVFLDGGQTNPLDGIDAGDITSAIYSYAHEFTGDINSTASSPDDETINEKSNMMTTVSTMYNGVVKVDVSDMIDASKVDRAVLTVAGEKVPMSQSGNEYTATFSEYLLDKLGNASTYDVNVSFFTTDFFSKTIGMVLDNEQPTRPSISINNPYLTDTTLTSSTDTAYFHVYKEDINDSKPLSHLVNTANTLVDYNVTATDGVAATYNFCSQVEGFNDNLGTYQIIAVDNGHYDATSDYYGNIYYNRASNVGYIPDSNNSYPIYKNASIYQIASGGTDRIPVLYDENCTLAATQLVNDDYGVSVKSLNGAEFNMSIETNSSVPALAETGVGALATVKIVVDHTEIGSIQFNRGYYTNHNQPVLIAYNGSIYKTDFQILESNSTSSDTTSGTGSTVSGGSLGKIYFTDANKTRLSGQSILGSE
jgi:hypothetical protein